MKKIMISLLVMAFLTIPNLYSDSMQMMYTSDRISVDSGESALMTQIQPLQLRIQMVDTLLQKADLLLEQPVVQVKTEDLKDVRASLLTIPADTRAAVQKEVYDKVVEIAMKLDARTAYEQAQAAVALAPSTPQVAVSAQVPSETSEVEQPAVPFDQYILMGGQYRAFETLAKNTALSQSYIDAHAAEFGHWSSYELKYTVESYFAHSYGAGKIIYSLQVGDTIVVHYRGGRTLNYRVIQKIDRPVLELYDYHSQFWKEAGNDMDALLQTCSVQTGYNTTLVLKLI